MIKRKKFKDEKFCKACGVSSNKKNLSRFEEEYYCDKHVNQLKKYGKLLDNNQRTTRDPNEIIIYKDLGYAEIVLYNQDTSESGRAIIDIDDVEKVKPYKWRLTDKSTKRKKIKYVYTGSGAGNQLPLHRLITDAPNSLIPDHIDSNPLNNRKSNLRLVTEEFNLINKEVKPYHKFGFNGVYATSTDKKKSYKTEIGYRKVRVYFKHFETLEEAVLARLLSELMIFGDYRSTLNDKNIIKKIKNFNETEVYNLMDYVKDKCSIKLSDQIDFNKTYKYAENFLKENNLILKGETN